MSKVIDINKYKKQETIFLDIEERLAMFRAFFNTPFRIIACTDQNDNIIDYQAIIGDPDPTESMEDQAAINWNEQFRNRYFIDVESILITYMDCYLEIKQG